MQDLPADLIAIKDEAFADLILHGLGGPDSLNKAALLNAGSDHDL